MKGKKIISAALAGVMALSLTACGGGSAQETTAAPAAGSKAEETTAAAEGSEAATGEGVTKEDLKVGFIFIGDENEGYTAAHYKGAKEMQEALGLNDDQLIVKWNIPEDETAKDAAMDLADQGCQIVFANSFGHESYVIEAAKEYPEVQFCHATGFQAAGSGLSNMHNFFTSIYEARYVSGVVAGLKLNQMIEDGTVKEDACKIGYVGAYPYAEVISGYTSFFLGARSVCPSATMEVKYTNSWASFDLEKEASGQAISPAGCCLVRGSQRVGMSNNRLRFTVRREDSNKAAARSAASKATARLCLACGCQPVGMSNKRTTVHPGENRTVLKPVKHICVLVFLFSVRREDSSYPFLFFIQIRYSPSVMRVSRYRMGVQHASRMGMGRFPVA